MAIKQAHRLEGIDINVVACVDAVADIMQQEYGRDITVMQSHRSHIHQKAIYAQGRETLEIVNRLRREAGLPPITAKENKVVSNARVGSSPHEFGCAVDIWVLSADNKTVDWDNEDMLNAMERAVAAQKGRVAWGAKFKSIKDNPHLELTWWREVRDGIRAIMPHTTESK